MGINVQTVGVQTVGVQTVGTRLRKALVVLGCVLLVVLAIAVAYSLEPQVWYSQATNYSYEKQSSGWVTYNDQTDSTSNGSFTDVYCQDKGSFSCKFTLVVQLTGASFILNNSTPQMSLQEAELPITLQGGQSTTTRLYFSIDQNVTIFYISIGVKPNQLFMQSRNVMFLGFGQNPLPYYKSSDLRSNETFEPNAY